MELRASTPPPLRISYDFKKVKYTSRSLLIVAVLLCVILITLGILLFRPPDTYKNLEEFTKFPTDLHDLKLLGAALLKYRCVYYWRILLTITVVYIFLQSFMIPGSALCSFLLGYLFPIPLALFVIAFCSAVGASCCYVIFDFIGSRTVLNLFPERIAACQQMMSRFKNTMCFTIFLFRLSPIIPNWLVNISSPLLGVPLVDFFMGTFIGVIPLSLFFVKAGTMLQELTDIGVTSVASIYTLILFAVISVVPILLQNQIKNFLSG
uniref:Transmembrane protein 41B n=1 Tax=Echinococcus granulosus TaxID=6210 RepID=A0A068WBF5_ECHGR|nr:transmembrane protein 41B [Echinococcus granulosus]